MKTVFISVPMNGRTKEAILASQESILRKAESYYGEDLEMVQTFLDEIPEDTSKNLRVACLGMSIMKLATADYYVGMKNPRYYNGCMVENEVAMLYDIPHWFYPMTESDFPDIWESYHNNYRSNF